MAKGIDTSYLDGTAKEFGIERWVCIKIRLVALKPDGSSDHNADKKLLAMYDLPRDLYERKEWIVRWRMAYWQCKYPRNHIERSHTYYDKKTGSTEIYSAALEVRTCRANVTKILKAMESYKQQYVPTFFNPSPETTDSWKKALLKLGDYRCRLEQAEIDLARIQQNAKPL